MSMSSSTWFNPQILPTTEQPTAVPGYSSQFLLSHTPVPNSLALYLNGIYLTPGVDYILTEKTGLVTMTNAPSGDDNLRACYLR